MLQFNTVLLMFQLNGIEEPPSDEVNAARLMEMRQFSTRAGLNEWGLARVHKLQTGRLEACTTTGTRPVLRSSAQAGGDGVLLNVVGKLIDMFRLADQVIERLSFPERTLSAKKAVDLRGREGLPRMEDGAEVVARERLHDDVNVIRHNAPGSKAVPLPVEVQEGILNNGGQVRPAQST
jgi:hypothetical protein